MCGTRSLLRCRRCLVAFQMRGIQRVYSRDLLALSALCTEVMQQATHMESLSAELSQKPDLPRAVYVQPASCEDGADT